MTLLDVYQYILLNFLDFESITRKLIQIFETEQTIHFKALEKNSSVIK
jgi:hypothetical protein